MNDTLNSYMSVREVAAKLDFTVPYIHLLMKNGVFEHFRMGKQWIISKSSLDEFIKKRNKK